MPRQDSTKQKWEKYTLRYEREEVAYIGNVCLNKRIKKVWVRWPNGKEEIVNLYNYLNMQIFYNGATVYIPLWTKKLKFKLLPDDFEREGKVLS